MREKIEKSVIKRKDLFSHVREIQGRETDLTQILHNQTILITF